MCSRQRHVRPPIPVRVRERQIRPSLLFRQDAINPFVTRIHELHINEGIRGHNGQVGRRRPEIVERGRLLRRIPQAVPGGPVGRVHHQQVAQDARAGFGFGSVPAVQCVQGPVQPGLNVAGYGLEQPCHPPVPGRCFPRPPQPDQDCVQLDEHGQVIRFKFEHGLQFVQGILVLEIRPPQPSHLGEILVPEHHVGRVVSHGVGQQVQGGFAVSPRRHDIGFDGKDFSVLRSKFHGPVGGSGGPSVVL